MSENKKKTTDYANQMLKGASISWKHSAMQTTYSNVVNVTSTREELAIFFGTNKTWDLEEVQEIVVEFTHRILMNPYAAKRLSILLTRVMDEYELRFGPLGLGEKTHTMH